MDTTTTSPAAVQAFQKFYFAELDARVRHSEVVGSITLAKGSAAVFYDSASDKFTLVEKAQDAAEANIYECVPREQWGRLVMLFGHATQSGGYIASGHATLDGNLLKIKLASGAFYRMEVDPTQPHLQPFVFTSPAPTQPKRSNTRRSPFSTSGGKPRNGKSRPEEPVPLPVQQGDDTASEVESSDFTAEDLRRLRGEISVTYKPKKKIKQWTY